MRICMSRTPLPPKRALNQLTLSHLVALASLTSPVLLSVVTSPIVFPMNCSPSLGNVMGMKSARDAFL